MLDAKRDIREALSEGHLKPDGNDWYDMVIGIFVGMGIYGGVAVLFMMKLKVPKTWISIYLLILFIVIVYLYWRDTKIKIVETGLAKNENLNLLRGVFKQLDWSTYELSEEILIQDNKYILKFIRGRIMYSDNFIGYNFQYTSTSKSGRPAFFFGIRTYLKNQFEAELKILGTKK